MFGFMREFWTIPTTDMTYTKSQNYTNMVVDKHKIQTLKVKIVVLLFCYCRVIVFVPTSAHSLLIFLTSGLSNVLKY
jgi:hypothetical protein